MAEERLQKIIARAGLASRRAAEELIEMGRVTVNGQKARLGMSADPHRDDILVDGERLKLPESFDYFMLNKPKGVISDEDVSGNHQSARDLIPVEGHLYPVGRLDLGSEGLMLFTNDGALAHRLTHPRYDHPKTYQVLLDGNVQEETLDRWRHGIVIEGKRTRPAHVDKIRKSRSGTLLEVTLREGRKRQIRKVASTLGHTVISLTRTKLGPLELGDLPVGAWRRLTIEEVAALEMVRDAQEIRLIRRSAGPPRRAGSSAKGHIRQTDSRSRRESQGKFRNRSGDAQQSGTKRRSYRPSEEPNKSRPHFRASTEERSERARSSQSPSSEDHRPAYRSGEGAAGSHSSHRPTYGRSPHYGSSSTDEHSKHPSARRRPGSTRQPDRTGPRRPLTSGRSKEKGQSKSLNTGRRPETPRRPNRAIRPKRGSDR